MTGISLRPAVLAFIVCLIVAGAAQAAVSVVEDQEASGIGWPETPTWSTYTADYGGSDVGIGTTRYSQTHTVDANSAGTVGKFFFRYNNPTLDPTVETYDLEIYEVANPTGDQDPNDPNVYVLNVDPNDKILDVSFSLTKATTATYPVLTIELTGADRPTLEAGKAYDFELIGSNGGSMNVRRRGGSAGSGRRLYVDRVMLYPTGGKDSVIGYTVIPEPATMALLALGGVAALIRRRRS